MLVLFFTHIYFPASGQAVVTSPPRFEPSTFIAHRVQQCHCSSIFHRVLLTHALALSASQFVRKKRSPRIYTTTHSGGFELTKLTYTRLKDNLIHHRGDRLHRLLRAPSSVGRRDSMRVDEERKGWDLIVVKPKARAIVGRGEKSLLSGRGHELRRVSREKEHKKCAK